MRLISAVSGVQVPAPAPIFEPGKGAVGLAFALCPLPSALTDDPLARRVARTIKRRGLCGRATGRDARSPAGPIRSRSCSCFATSPQPAVRPGGAHSRQPSASRRGSRRRRAVLPRAGRATRAADRVERVDVGRVHAQRVSRSKPRRAICGTRLSATPPIGWARRSWRPAIRSTIRPRPSC